MLELEQQYVVGGALLPAASERASIAESLRDRATGAGHPGLGKRARNLAAIFDPQSDQPFGVMPGMTVKDPAFLIPMGCAAMNEKSLPDEALVVWLDVLRPGMPSLPWRVCEREVRELAALQATAIVPRLESRRLTFSYAPLSGPTVELTRYSGAAVLRAPTELREALGSAERSLERYAKSIRNVPADADAIRLARLPDELFEQRVASGSADAVLRKARELDRPMPVHGVVAELFGVRAVEPLHVVLASELLERVGRGFEPDPRFLAPMPGPDTVLDFMSVEPGPTRPSGAFVNAVALLQIGAAIAAADGLLAGEEKRALASRVESTPGLTDVDRERLAHRITRVLESPPDPEQLVQRLRSARGAARDSIAHVLVSVAASDGRVDELEHEFLLRSFRAMGLTKTVLNEMLAEHDAEVAVAPRRRAERRLVDRRSEVGRADDDKRFDALTSLLLGADAELVTS